jgi:hypothetical protein
LDRVAVVFVIVSVMAGEEAAHIPATERRSIGIWTKNPSRFRND